ncbi:MAG: RHS repeat domain-containing protein [Bacteroidales bacterium]
MQKTQNDVSIDAIASGFQFSFGEMAGISFCLESAIASGFRFGFGEMASISSRGGHVCAFTYNYVKTCPKHPAPHDLSARLISQAQTSSFNFTNFTNLMTIASVLSKTSPALGSSSFITDATGYATQHLQYLPFGETFVDQQNGYDSRYSFSAKEKDDETQYSYFGARYYDSDLSVWLSVDPMSDEHPYQSPYMYCSGNPVMRIDPNGMNDGWYVDETGTIIGKDKNDDDRLYFVTGRDAVKVKEDNFTNGVDQSELQDAREIPSFEQRQKLKECYDKGEKDPTHEYGMLINTTEDNSAWSYALFKGDPSDPYAEDGHKGRVRFGDPSTIIEMGGDLNGVKETKYQAHTHNVKPTEWPVRAVPPTPGADKVSPGVTGLVFETNVGRVYIHSSITKRRDMDFMSSSVFFGSFVYNGISY